MPLYDYRCQSCGHELEALQGMNDAPLSTCPECGNDTLKKQVAAPAFTFKGGGWYKDLYGSSKPKTESKKESTSDTKSETKTKKKTTTKSPD